MWTLLIVLKDEGSIGLGDRRIVFVIFQVVKIKSYWVFFTYIIRKMVLCPFCCQRRKHSWGKNNWMVDTMIWFCVCGASAWPGSSETLLLGKTDHTRGGWKFIGSVVSSSVSRDAASKECNWNDASLHILKFCAIRRWHSALFSPRSITQGRTSY